MPTAPVHRILAAHLHQVPAPFGAFAVRSEEARHAYHARAPYGRVHLVQTSFLDPLSQARLVDQGLARVTLESFSDIDYAATTWRELAAGAPGVGDLAGHIASALQVTGVLGPDAACYRRSVASRVDYLASCGAGFHNDVSRHWSRCLFWILALQAADVEFVMPHAGLRVALTPGDLLTFDPAMAHGLCRPRDQGVALAASFQSGSDRLQLFLTGELLLSDARWAALGAPWLPVEAHERRGAIDLLVAGFDDCSGAIQRLSALRDGMKRSVCHVEGATANGRRKS